MRKLITVLCLFVSLSAYSQERTPIKLVMTVAYSQVDNSTKLYLPAQSGSFSIRLHENGTYSWTDQTSFSQKTVSGVYTLSGEKLELTGDDGTKKEFTVQVLDNVFTKLSSGSKVYYMLRQKDQ